MVFHGTNITLAIAWRMSSGRVKSTNGRPARPGDTPAEGAHVESVDLLHDGSPARRSLLDIARDPEAKTGSNPGEPILPDDLEAAEQACRVRVEPGDILAYSHRLCASAR